MTGIVPPWLWAVHISDGVLTAPWIGGGFLFAAGLAWLGCRHVRDEEIPPIALLTAAFFVASLIHVRVGPTSAHLLLNGLLGVVLGTRACLAVPVGLFLQAALMAHGGFSTLGANCCVMALPALVAGWMFAALQHVRWWRRPWFRAGVVFFSFALWSLSLIFALALLITNRIGGAIDRNAWSADQITFQPMTLIVVFVLAGLGAWAERRMENAPEFPLGLLIGTVTVLLTLLLNCLVLVWGADEDWRTLALLLFVAHMPIAAIEGLIVGLTVGFLVRVKPDLIRWSVSEKTECPVDVRT